MGYNLYITRKREWFEEDGPAIALSEWQALVNSDTELSWDLANGEGFANWMPVGTEPTGWIAWDGGNLESKNPNTPLIRKMAALAQALGARVVGEEGEAYSLDGQATPVAARLQAGLLHRLRAWWSRWFGPAPAAVGADDLPFQVGARVRDPWGKLATVMSIDFNAEYGMGVIAVRYDDGRASTVTAIAHGLEAIESTR